MWCLGCNPSNICLSAVFSSGGGGYSSHQQQQHASLNGGGSYLPTNTQDLHFHLSEARNSEVLASGSRPLNLSNTASGGGSYDQLMQQYQHFQKQAQIRLASPFRDQDLKLTHASQSTAEQIVEPARQWHCPACRDGPGSIHWFWGMKSFVTHVKTKGTRRPRLHWDFAQLLDEELCRRGDTLVKAGESYGKWKGLDKDVEDREIVWPPMVIVMNTQLEKDENEKWLGMGTQELLEYFESYEAVKARNSFGPEGHRGMSVLIFDTSAVGYIEAERLGKHFER